MSLAELLALLDTLNTLSDEELAQLETDLQRTMEALLDGDELTDDTLAEAEQAANGIESVRAEAANREAAAADRAARADALRDRVRAEAESAEGDEGEPAEGAEAEAEGAEEEGAEAEPLPVAASRRPATPAVAARAPSRVAARGQATPGRQQASSPTLAFNQWGLVASANAPGVPAGSPVTDYDQLAQVFAQAYRTITGPSMGPRAQVPLVRAGHGPLALYGEERFLDGHAQSNATKIRNVVHPDAVTAAGGMCAPININYDLPVLGSDARPVRDTAMARFGADRGGVRTLIPPVLADVTGAIGIWTNAMDIAASTQPAGPEKPCITIDCPDETESLVYAITQCFRTGNFRQRFFPEQIEAVMKLIGIAHARLADTTLLQAIEASSTTTTTVRLLGTTRDLLANLDMAMSAFRDRWRLADGDRLRFVAPRWLRDELRADMARTLPGTTAESVAIADATIANWIAMRGVNVTWAMDGTVAGQHFAAQTAGALEKWPNVARTYLYPEGAHLFLDGGTLDLGLVRDSTLNATNDLMFFAETFEGHHYQGPESLRIDMTLCPDGSVAGTADVDPCA